MYSWNEYNWKSLIKNNWFKKKIGKQEEITNEQGFLFVFRIEENNWEFNFRETWRRKYKVRTRCKYYDIESRFLIIGRTDRIIIYTFFR